MLKNNGAIAIFVETPGLSQPKRRLAGEIGRIKALSFYHHSCSAISEIVDTVIKESLSPPTPYWAVTEKNGLAAWRGFTSIWQGDGTLTDRMLQIYNLLVAKHGFAIILGDDTPQLAPDIIRQTLHYLSSSSDFVVGPLRDGGFYLFGGTRSIPPDEWQKLTHGRPSLACALQSISAINSAYINFLPMLTDVDHEKDLHTMGEELKKLEFKSKSQKALLELFLLY